MVRITGILQKISVDAGTRVGADPGCMKNVLPTPLPACIGILSIQCVGQIHPRQTVFQVFGMVFVVK